MDNQGKMMRNLLFLTILFGIIISSQVHALDSAALYSENKLSSNIRKSASCSVPIGTVVVWTSHTMPDDGEWLECDGRTVPSDAYEYRSKFGSRTPDYAGYFLRGVGGNSADLGVEQGDAIRNFKGFLGGGLWGHVTSGVASGIVGLQSYGRPYLLHATEGINSHRPYSYNFDASREVPTANENRPINKAVKYIIKVK